MSSLNPQQALTASTRVVHEVFLNGQSTRRRFTNLPAAQRYAHMIGGEVRAVS